MDVYREMLINDASKMHLSNLDTRDNAVKPKPGRWYREGKLCLEGPLWRIALSAIWQI
jgi:hypothetical protein